MSLIPGPESVNPSDRLFFSKPNGLEGRVYDIENLLPIQDVLNSGTISKTYRPGHSKDNPTRKRKRVLKPTEVYLPLELDCEFITPTSKKDEPESYKRIVKACQEVGKGSITLTTQVRGIVEEGPGNIFLSPDFVKVFPEQQTTIKPSNNILVSFFEEKGHKARFIWCADDNELGIKSVRTQRVIKVDVFAHFAVADFYKLWCDYRITDYLLSKSWGPARKIHQQKYLKIENIYTREKTEVVNGVTIKTQKVTKYRFMRIPALLYIDDVPFALEIGCVDTSAMLGEGGRSLKDCREASGISISEIKDYYTSDEKGHMLQQFVSSEDSVSVYDQINNPYKRIFDLNDPHFKAAEEKRRFQKIASPFIDYALGDVSSLHETVIGIGKQMREIYKSLGTDRDYQFPAPTIGSTVANILLSVVKKQFRDIEAEVTKLEDCAKYLPVKQRFWAFRSEAIQSLINTAFDKSSAVNLSKVNNKSALLAKVIGGRVISKSATFISGKGVFPDLDVSGAYPWGMKSQPLPLGNPIIWPDCGTRESDNKMMTLQQFFDKNGSELVDGCWKLLFSVLDDFGNPLPNPVDQDFFPSWTPSPSFINKQRSTDCGDWVTKSDKVKYYRREILNTPLTSDSKDILDFVICPENRKHIMKYGRVIAYMYYPKSKLVRNAEDFVRFYIQHQTEIEKNKKRKVKKNVGEFNYWFKEDVGTLISNGLIDKRKFWKRYTHAYTTIKKKGVFDLDTFKGLEEEVMADIVDLAGGESRVLSFIENALGRSKHPLDTVFKTVANTIYGDLTSKFFKISLPICGEGITTRVRCLIYMLETACRCTNVITDGGFFEANNVNYPYTEEKYCRKTGQNKFVTYPLTDKNTFASLDKRTKDQQDKYKVKVAPIGNYDKIIWAGDETTDILFIKDGIARRKTVEESMKYMCDLASEHIRNCFSPEIKILSGPHKFKFEAKGIVKSFANHGTANYYCEGGWHGSYPTIENSDGTKTTRPWSVTFRSYKQDFRDNNLRLFFQQLIESPNYVDRMSYATIEYRTTILTVEKYAAARDVTNSKLAATILQPGDTEITAQLFREFTPSVFRYINHEQEKSCESFNIDMRDVGNPYDENTSKIYYGQSYEGLPQFVVRFDCDRVGEEGDEDWIDPQHLKYKDMMTYIDSLVSKGESLKMDKGLFTQHPMLHHFRKAKGDLLIDWMRTNVNPNNIVFDDIPTTVVDGMPMTRAEFMAMMNEGTDDW